MLPGLTKCNGTRHAKGGVQGVYSRQVPVVHEQQRCRATGGLAPHAYSYRACHISRYKHTCKDNQRQGRRRHHSVKTCGRRRRGRQRRRQRRRLQFNHSSKGGTRYHGHHNLRKDLQVSRVFHAMRTCNSREGHRNHEGGRRSHRRHRINVTMRIRQRYSNRPYRHSRTARHIKPDGSSDRDPRQRRRREDKRRRRRNSYNHGVTDHRCKGRRRRRRPEHTQNTSSDSHNVHPQHNNNVRRLTRANVNQRRHLEVCQHTKRCTPGRVPV